MKKIAKLTHEAKRKFDNREHGGVITMNYYHEVEKIVKAYEEEKAQVKATNDLQEQYSKGE